MNVHIAARDLAYRGLVIAHDRDYHAPPAARVNAVPDPDPVRDLAPVARDLYHSAVAVSGLADDLDLALACQVAALYGYLFPDRACPTFAVRPEAPVCLSPYLDSAVRTLPCPWRCRGVKTERWS
ncbi:MAG: hypothetical protein JWO71_1358 [Candidatus Acidoferrum typicum]|nr:hypothetical protein [Candidatus Acidoferrum typicum]